ncbi:MAG TPA: hypothetical protein VN516_06335, partial [Candidatus Baltobacteraceae bacterium]|nr:hypothetical protein [Candidatus Baltobacteraceae bacterium]
MSAEALPEFEKFLQTDCAKKFTAEEKLISSRRLNENEIAPLHEVPELKNIFAGIKGGAFFEHEKVSFISYPHEWPLEMLWVAGKLTLEIAQAALAEGFCLKDATPNNILFRGSAPVFVDVLSFERRNPNDPIW